MTNTIIKLAYYIEGSKSYQKFRTFLLHLLEDTSRKEKKFFDLLMIFFVISTVGILVYEVQHTVPNILIQYEYFVVFIFILEWLGRFILSFESHKQIIRDYEEAQFLNMPYDIVSSLKIITRKKLHYVFSMASIIDLLAILPSYRPLRILRVFLLFRLFKVLRYSNSLNQFIKVFVEKKLELSLLLMLYILVIFFSATILYVYEGNGLNPKILHFGDAIYWAFITVSTIGYGDITPMSEAGKIITVVLILTSYTVIAFFTSIVTSSINEKLDGIKELNIISNIKKYKEYILICGYGRSGHALVQSLKLNYHNLLVIEKEPIDISIGKTDDIHVIKDDATNIDLLKQIGINRNIKEVVILTNNDAVNLSIILSIRSLNKDIPILARCNRFKTKNKLKLAGATNIIEINETAALVAMGYIKAPIAYEAIDDILVDYKGALMSEVEVFAYSPFIGQKLSAIEFDKFHINFIGLFHHENPTNFIFNPDKEETILQEKDFLIIIGYERSIDDFKTYIQSQKSIMIG